VGVLEEEGQLHVDVLVAALGSLELMVDFVGDYVYDDIFCCYIGILGIAVVF
jgi:hypothetical protein